MPLEPTSNGLLARVGDYEPLRAFSQGGVYWDKVPQQLIRESSLAQFLPPVEVEKDDQGKFGRFHLEEGGRELLSRSKSLGGRRIPRRQLDRLKHAVGEFKDKGRDPGAQQHNRELIERFRLPNPRLEPELYRLVGSWWNYRLQILWGCERTRDSSLALTAAVGGLPEDRSYNLRRLLAALLLLLLLLLPAWWVATHWDQVKGWIAQTTQPPFAGPGNPTPEQRAEADVEKAREAAKQAEAAAQKAQADAEKAAADAQRARQAADGTKADVDRKQQEAADALAAAKKAEELAQQARAAADRAKDAALAAEKAAEQAKLAKPPSQPQSAKNAAGKPSSPNQPSSPIPGAPPLPSPGAGSALPSPSGQKTPSAESAPQPNAAPQGQIVLCDQGQPAADGTMTVTLEVRPLTDPARALPVQAWTYDGNTVTGRDRLQTNLKGGDHLIKATFRDAAGNPAEVQALLTVEPGKVITTSGSVSLRPKAAH
jgi:hypothetical protein